MDAQTDGAVQGPSSGNHGSDGRSPSPPWGLFDSREGLGRGWGSCQSSLWEQHPTFLCAPQLGTGLQLGSKSWDKDLAFPADPQPGLGSRSHPGLQLCAPESEGSSLLPGCAAGVGASRAASSQISSQEDRSGPGLGARQLRGIPGGILAVQIHHQCSILAPVFPGQARVHPDPSPRFQPVLAVLRLLIPVLAAEREAEISAGLRGNSRDPEAEKAHPEAPAPCLPTRSGLGARLVSAPLRPCPGAGMAAVPVPARLSPSRPILS